MSKTEVIKFLHSLFQQPKLLLKLRDMPKQEVLNLAKESGYLFTEQELDDTVWNLEIFLANKLGEKFDLTFSLWETMWGKYYLEFLVENVIGSLSTQEIDNFLNQ